MPRIRRSQRVILRAQDDEDACDEEDDNEEKEKDGEEKEKAENTTTIIVRPHFNLIKPYFTALPFQFDLQS